MARLNINRGTTYSITFNYLVNGVDYVVGSAPATVNSGFFGLM